MEGAYPYTNGKAHLVDPKKHEALKKENQQLKSDNEVLRSQNEGLKQTQARFNDAIDERDHKIRELQKKLDEQQWSHPIDTPTTVPNEESVNLKRSSINEPGEAVLRGFPLKTDRNVRLICIAALVIGALLCLFIAMSNRPVTPYKEPHKQKRQLQNRSMVPTHINTHFYAAAFANVSQP